MNTLWVDDIRDPYVAMGFTENVMWATTFHEGMNALKSGEQFESIYLDNDLQNVHGYQGKHIFNQIEFLLHEGYLQNLKTIFIHSDNSSAVSNMLSAVELFKEKYGVKVKRITYSS